MKNINDLPVIVDIYISGTTTEIKLIEKEILKFKTTKQSCKVVR